ncbi:MAG: alkaline phosphatase family protein [bacterium]
MRRLPAAAALLLLFSFAAHAKTERVILISIDSMNNSYVFNEWQNRDFELTPNIGEMVRNGASFARAETALPSLTQINHLTMVCGCYPDRIGFAGNEAYEPSVRGPIRFLFPWKKPEMIKCDTIMKAMKRSDPGFTTAVVAGKDYVGCPIEADYTVGPACLSESVRKEFPEIRPFPEVGGWDSPDEWVMGNALRILDRKDPDFLFLHLGFVDPAQHNFGNGSTEAWAAVAWADHLVGTLIAYLRESGRLPGTLMVLTADHGQSNLWHSVDLKDFLEKKGIGVEFVHAGPLSHVFLKNSSDAERAAKLLRRLESVDGAWWGKTLDEIHIRTPYTGDVVVSTRPPYSAGVFRGPFDVRLKAPDVGQHGGLAQRFVPLVFTGPGVRRGVILDGEARATLADVTPTIAALAGLPLPNDVQGKALPVGAVDDPSGAGARTGPDLQPKLISETPRGGSLAVAVFAFIAAAALLGIRDGAEGERRRSARQSLLAVIALSLASCAVLFIQFIRLYAGVPGIMPDQFLLGRAPILWGTPVISHTAVQLVSWMAAWAVFGGVLCASARLLTKRAGTAHFKRFPVYMTPLAWTLLLLTAYHYFLSVPFYHVRSLFFGAWLAGFALSAVKMYRGAAEDGETGRGAAAASAALTAAVFLACVWLLFRAPTALFVLGQVTLFPLGTH